MSLSEPIYIDMLSKISTALLLTSFYLPLQAKTRCGTIEEARSAYERSAQEAIAILTCIKKEHPEDTAARRLLSDIHWWEGDTDASIAEARELSQIPSSQDDLTIHLKKRLSEFSVRGAFAGVWGNNQSGYEISAEGDARYYKKNHVLLGYDRKTRFFQNGSSVSDNIYSATHVGVHGKRVYSEAVFRLAPDSQFSPRYSIRLEPHYVFEDESDVSLGLQFNHYPSLDAYRAVLRWLRPYWERWTLGLTIDLNWAPDFIAAGQVIAKFQIDPRTAVRATFGGGRTQEDQNLKADFWNPGLSFEHRVILPLLLRLHGEIYRSSARREERLGIELEWNF